VSRVNYKITAQYGGDSNYSSSSNFFDPMQVSPGPTTVTVTPVPPTSVSDGTQLTFTVIVTANVEFLGQLSPSGDGSVADDGQQNPVELDQTAGPTSTASPVNVLLVEARTHILQGGICLTPPRLMLKTSPSIIPSQSHKLLPLQSPRPMTHRTCISTLKTQPLLP
jgi:hypothetical protein